MELLLTGIGVEGEGIWNSLVSRLSLRFLLDIQAELMDTKQAGGCRELREKAGVGYRVSQMIKHQL